MTGGPDARNRPRTLVKVWQKFNDKRFAKRDAEQPAGRGRKRAPDALVARFEGEQAPGEPRPYDALLVSVGPHSERKSGFGAERARAVRVDEARIHTDRQFSAAPTCRTSSRSETSPAARCWPTRPTHEGHVAAEAASGLKSHFDASVIPSVAYTDPEIAWVGVTEDEGAAQSGRRPSQGIVSVGLRRAGPSRTGADEGFTKLLFDPETHRIVGREGVVGAPCRRT